MEYTAEMIAAALGGDVVGNKEAKVTTFAKIEEGVEGALSFMANPKYEHYVYSTRSSVVVVNRSFEPKEPVSATLVKVDDAYGCFAKLLEIYTAGKPQKKGIHPTAVIDPSATIGKDCYVGAYAVIEAGVKVGDETKIYPHVYIGEGVKVGNGVTLYSGVKVYEGCKIGNRCTVHSGAVIGADGFGFAPNAEGVFEKIPQIGIVTLEDDVEIGANTTVDRATMGTTLISRGVKLDNQIQIAHNVTIGENTVMAAQSGVAGSAKIGRNCMIGGQAGIVGHITIGNYCQIGSASGASRSIPDGSVMMGNPPFDAARFRRANAVFRNLGDLAAKVNRLEKEIAKLKEEQ